MRRVLPIWAAFVGLIVCIGTTFAVLGWIQLQHEREHNTLQSCISRENEHAALRSILTRFHINVTTLPTDPVTGRPALAPLPGSGTTRQRCKDFARART